MNTKENIAIAKLRSDQILELIFLQENKTLNVEEVRHGWKLGECLDAKKLSAVLLKTGAWTLLDKEAGQFALAEMKKWKAVAVVVHNNAQWILGAVGFGIMGQSHKLKVFTKELEAEHWLKLKLSSQ